MSGKSRLAAWTALVGTLLVLSVIAFLMHGARSAPSDPVAADPVAADPVAADPVAADPVAADPAALTGSWLVSGDPPIDGRELRLHSGGRISLREGACVLGGGWSATASGLMIVSIHSATNECRNLDDPFEFFKGVQRYTLSASSARLLTLSGDLVAVLTKHEAPEATDSFTPRGPAPTLPNGLTVPSAEVLTASRWIPVETVGSSRWPDKTRPHAQFNVDGTWHGADGCNGVGAPWSMDVETGEWLAGIGGQTQIFCENVDVSGVVGPARTVGLDGDELVFFDTAGEETGRLVSEG